LLCSIKVGFPIDQFDIAEEWLAGRGTREPDADFRERFLRASEVARAAEFAVGFYELAHELHDVFRSKNGKGGGQFDARQHHALPGIRAGRYRIEVRPVASEVEVRGYEYRADEHNKFRPVSAPDLGFDETIAIGSLDAVQAQRKKLEILHRFLRIALAQQVLAAV